LCSYYRVIAVLWKSTQNMVVLTNHGSRYTDQRSANALAMEEKSRRLTQGEEATRKVNQGRKQIIKMLLVIILVFTLCWSPRFTLNLIKWTSPGTNDTKFSTTFLYFSQVAKLLPFLHATINPIIFCLMSGSSKYFQCCQQKQPIAQMVHTSRSMVATVS